MTRVIAHLGFLDPQGLIQAAGPWALLAVCAAVFVETGLLVGFFLPGDTLLFFTGVLALTGAFPQPLWLIIVAVVIAAALGDQVGYVIGRRAGPAVFERKEAGLFSRASVARTQGFFDRFGGAAVMIARFIAVIRTLAPVAAGVGKMRWLHFTVYNIVGAAIWATAVVLIGYGLGQVPGVAQFVSSYLDLVLIGIVVISVVPLLIRLVAMRRRSRAESRAEN
ncbi:DedA family protein [Leifsonia sp. AG29]|uniref:DedA family protein n=1 Tax=Leifsonia sp. AG29 TaxID=2598860 RepID=UPI00131CA53B|nr:VTT domain-containing protein [Leifsonia sp. AG29]